MDRIATVSLRRSTAAPYRVTSQTESAERMRQITEYGRFRCALRRCFSLHFQLTEVSVSPFPSVCTLVGKERGDTMRFTTTSLAISTVVALAGLPATTLAQGASDNNNGNPSIVEVVQALQAEISALQTSVNALIA